jgi:hypothetical protein
MIRVARRIAADEVERAHNALRAFYRRRGYLERGPFAVGPIAVICFEKVLP